jgi:hypothetical protein
VAVEVVVEVLMVVAAAAAAAAAVHTNSRQQVGRGMHCLLVCILSISRCSPTTVRFIAAVVGQLAGSAIGWSLRMAKY